jgi:HEAT repeat protein
VLVVAGTWLGRATAPVPPADPQLAELRSELREMRTMVALSLLRQPSASERLSGITWTGQLDQPGADVASALLDTLKHDPSVNVRLASIDALKRFADLEAVRRGAVDALDSQTAPLVQIALIDFLVEVDVPDAAAVLRRLSGDPLLDAAVRARAARGLDAIG